MASSEFCHILKAIDNNEETASVVTENTNKEANEVELCMDEENGGGEPLDDASGDTDGMEGKSDYIDEENSASSDNESLDDSATNGSHMADEEIAAVEDSEVVTSF